MEAAAVAVEPVEPVEPVPEPATEPETAPVPVPEAAQEVAAPEVAAPEVAVAAVERTIQIKDDVYTIKKMCSDVILLGDVRKLLDPKVPDNRYLIDCDNMPPMYTTVNIASDKGGLNMIYNLTDVKKVLRVSRPKSSDYTREDYAALQNNELGGLFIQRYLSSLCPQYICVVHEFGTMQLKNDLNAPIIVYAVIEKLGDDLGAVLEKQLEYSKIKNIIKSILEGLKCIHERGYAHLDLKPENILISGETAKIIDFGLARYVGETGQIIDYVAGSPGYLDPNLILDSYVSTRSDIYAVGVIALNSFFGLENTNEIYNKNVNTQYQFILMSSFPTKNHITIQWIQKNIIKKYNLTDEELELLQAVIRKMLLFKTKQPTPSRQNLTPPEIELRYTAQEALNDPWITSTPSVTVSAGGKRRTKKRKQTKKQKKRKYSKRRTKRRSK